MTNKNPKVVPYEHTLYDLLINNLKGKYLQNILDPRVIAQIPEKDQLGIHYIENEKLSVWFPLFNRWGDLSLEDFVNYAIISEEQFKDYQTNKGDVFDYLLVHKNSKLFKEHNEANLSAKSQENN
jgi:hypothetical protein